MVTPGLDAGGPQPQRCGLRPELRAARCARGLGTAAGRQDRVDRTDTERLAPGCRRRTARRTARSESGGGPGQPAVRRRSQDGDAVCRAARRPDCGGRLAPGRGTCDDPQGRAAENGAGTPRRCLAGAAASARFRASEASRPRGSIVTRLLWGGLLLVAVCACATRPPAPPAQGATPSSVAALVAAIEQDAQRSEREPDTKIRGELAADAGRDAQSCLALEPQGAACLYGRAIALGLNARAHPAHAGELLADMLATLTRAESADPDYDEAGPARVRALVLLRAPGWPLGPGDPEAALAAARRAVELQPRYPPNLLALAEALAKSATADRDGWLREADQGLQRNGSGNP